MGKKYLSLFNDVTGGPPRQLVLDLQADGSWLILGVTCPGKPTLETLSVSGLALSTLGVTDAVDLRFVTDAMLARLAILTALGTEQLLASVAAVDMNKDPETALYVVPGGKSCIITKVVLRNCSGNLTTASISFGFTAAAYSDVIANATHVTLTGNTLYEIVSAKVGAKVGVAAATFSVIDNTKQGAAMTLTIDVYGYLF